ncbi:hypothetical protein EVAR_8455_1 [Eumeta japonica]|uniref:Uncharacterized protein n=1 Tax=Eumeta variegata TaxID=151549 RepID=A0A4C1WBT1_EUMVA|nr:hypothetical protein EVAR_8455_1 [Eumeta japonica]
MTGVFGGVIWCRLTSRPVPAARTRRGGRRSARRVRNLCMINGARAIHHAATCKICPSKSEPAPLGAIQTIKVAGRARSRSFFTFHEALGGAALD